MRQAICVLRALDGYMMDEARARDFGQAVDTLKLRVDELATWNERLGEGEEFKKAIKVGRHLMERTEAIEKGMAEHYADRANNFRQLKKFERSTAL
jgi:hypothetical protein